jgi:5-methyltetrahydropteroyltriglutamate--homocysteine methyltransferase
MTTQHHAEHVGSLLRPPWLFEAREAHEKGTLSDAALREAEDRAVTAHLGLQQAAGIKVFTDGEARRGSWRAGLIEALDGLVPAERPTRWYRDGQELPADEVPRDGVAAAAKVTRKLDLTAVEASYLTRHAPGPFKITMVSASMGAMIWHPQISAAAYPAPADLIDDLVPLQLAEIDGLVAQGVRWIQLDSLAYNRVFDPVKSDNVRGGLSAEKLLDATVTVDAKIVAAVKRTHPGVTVAMHICRGNFRSAHGGSGSYEAVAERLFNEVPVDRFLLEYDTDRAGGFEPLRHLPKGDKIVVLGLVTSKFGTLESKDDVKRRIDEAAKYVDPDQLALSPQCGFASTEEGNVVAEDEQWAKLGRVVEIAREVWG